MANPFENVSKQLNLILTSDSDDRCYNHKNYEEDGVARVLNPITNKMTCPLCFREQQGKVDMQAATDVAIEWKLNEKYNALHRDSIVSDNTLLKASFETLADNGPEAHRNASKALELSNAIIDGGTMNIVLQGKAGVGKSHLAYSILRRVNEMSGKTRSCVFVDVSKMFVLIRGTFDNKESKYTEHYFDRLLSECDVLVMDDIGAEVGNISTDKQASDFVGRILRNILTGRQDKVTIYTTNLSSAELEHVYDEKTVSRMFRNVKPIVFKETKDMRKKNWGF